MNSNMQVNHQMARRFEAIYFTQDAARRRQAVLAAAKLLHGERVLDIGTGPGFLAYEAADRIGPSGEIVGLDINESMLELAGKRCADLSNVRFERADATALPMADATVDAVLCVQVYEFVPDTTKAISEIRRVLRPGGRAVIVTADWDSIAWHATDAALMETVLAAFKRRLAHTRLARTLASKLKQSGFELAHSEVIPQFNLTYGHDYYSFHFLRTIEGSVTGHEGLTEQDVLKWVRDQEMLGERGQFFFCFNQILFLAMKAA